MKKLIIILATITFCGCNTQQTLTTVKCVVDSVWKKQPISVEESITPTYMYRTNCGNIFSLYKQTYNIGDSIVFLTKTNK